MLQRSLQRPEHAPASSDLEEGKQRLREGLDWFCRTWTQNPDQPWPDDLVVKWTHFMDRWVELERKLRAEHSWSGCPYEPEGRCDPAGPLVCEACAGATIRPTQPKQQQLFSMGKDH